MSGNVEGVYRFPGSSRNPGLLEFWKAKVEVEGEGKWDGWRGF